ncbi:MAG TPA: hypothetical protein VF530_13300 [Planctomycetota bacterium]
MVVLAGLLLVLFALVEHVLGPPSRPAGADRALEILVGAKGALLPPARLGTGPELVGEVIRLGERTLVPLPPRAGLRSALLAADGRLASQHTYALAADDEEAVALVTLVESAAEGSLLALASSGSLVPPGAAGLEALARALRALGARARPGARACESWALVALRLEDGWVPLAEGYSEESGVALALTLGPEAELRARRGGELVRARAPAEHEIFLHEELVHARRRSPGVTLTHQARLGGRPFPGIRMQALAPERDGTASSVDWSGVVLGPSSGFHAWVAVEPDAGGAAAGLEFELLVDGQRARALVVEPGASGRPFQVDLRPFAGRTVVLELRATPTEPGAAAAALWAVPMLVHGAARLPRESWWEPR